MAALASKVFNSGSTLVVPPGVTFMFAQGFGSGGGGGGGAGGTTGGVNNASGGGGGGAAPLGFAAFTVTPNETLTVTVGASAAGGAGGAANTHGSDGTAGNVSKVTNGSSVVVAQFAGGGPGQQGLPANSSPVVAMGGTSPANGANPAYRYVFNTTPAAQNVFTVAGGPGFGGASSNQTTTGADAQRGFDPGAALGAYVGGAGGTTGATSTNCGGTGGGGGGGGPGGNGGAGGNGPAGANTATGAAGATPSAPSANTGAGGGGGSAGANGNSTGGAGATGAASGSGQVTLYWFE